VEALLLEVNSTARESYQVGFHPLVGGAKIFPGSLQMAPVTRRTPSKQITLAAPVAERSPSPVSRTAANAV